MDLKGKVALITGAARRVGRGVALALAREGAHIVVHYGRAHDEAAETCQAIEALGVDVLPHSADLANPDEIAAMFAAARDRFGRLDVLVNSAARFDRQPFEAITVADWERSLAVNLRAPFLCAQHAAPLMRSSARPEGETALIVNISDLSGVYPWIGYTQHGVSKAGLLHLTKITARELAPHIRVNAIIPGPLLPPPGVSEDSAGWQAIIERVPLQRSGGVEPVADTVLYLAHSDFITGAAINLDAGEALIGPPRAGKG